MARPPRRSGNLPAETTSFIGRRRELAAVRRRLAEARLVSLVGPGGVGKTRLALRAAGDLGRGFPGGAWLVELAEVRDSALVGDAVMTALDLRTRTAAEPSAVLAAYLRDKRLLLVVDNCEHLLAATARLVTEVMRAAPGVRVIATSREPLSAPGEHVVPVPPLDPPAPHARPPLAELRRNEAVTLFTERAAASSGAFELTAANQAAVAGLCRRLDGLPLAIELAAVRTRVLSAEQILDRLDDRFGLLTGGAKALPRHQTLRTTIDWSHDLLDPAEQALLRRLCVFAGRFTLEDVEAVCAREGLPALEPLSSLVDKSLVTKEDAGDLACYRLHETMREYAALRLREAGEEETVGRRFADYYTTRCLRAAPQVRRRLAEWLDWMDLEIDNVRAVLRGCVTREDAARGMKLVYAIGYYWITRAPNEGVRWAEELLAREGAGPAERARAAFMRGFLAVLQSDAASAGPALDEAMAGAEEAGLPSVLAQSLSLASMAASMSGDRAAARRLGERARVVMEGVDDDAAVLMFLQSRALNGLFEGDLDTVVEAAEEGVRLGRETGDLYSLDMMLLNLGSARLIAGAFDEAGPLLAEALRVAYRIDDRVGQYVLLDALGCVTAGSGRARPAALLMGAAETVRTETGASVLPFLPPLLARAEEAARAELGAAAFEDEYAAGRRLSRDVAIRLALGEPVPSAGAPDETPDETPLGKRQAEVARLVAEGLSNRQIGERLFISEHTVDSHVRAIMNKLGFNSRAQIAAWTASCGS
ncbi:ATP-binding protein [Planomonospora venezuelensis]|uniref:Putative ATPase/DNA-binding CsgD family transcriptional regulator n=1 Tax=Planomonospora venezuelensis TaxID=1999 RepID=A0A841DIS2_PLAVE|nr:LuxR C-terminal-related transcriptional regulator [Planomonospora venezuelensis]MBB5967975.1 putative ATPase/DNA-binding CsgD family transcriptional regulator [Planomonospora venezuelensis]GIN00364.1 LuxR family transcriptional regulator [Planomonospora venezuelensis]